MTTALVGSSVGTVLDSTELADVNGAAVVSFSEDGRTVGESLGGWERGFLLDEGNEVGDSVGGSDSPSPGTILLSLLVGTKEGLLLGAGFFFRLNVGSSVGSDVGLNVGSDVASSVGSSVGLLVPNLAALVGLNDDCVNDGSRVGSDVGLNVGSDAASSVGSSVGLLVPNLRALVGFTIDGAHVDNGPSFRLEGCAVVTIDVNFVDGALVGGKSVGSAVGSTVGSSVGSTVGSVDSSSVGSNVGSNVLTESVGVGVNFGTLDFVDSRVWAIVGATVGESVISGFGIVIDWLTETLLSSDLGGSSIVVVLKFPLGAQTGSCT
jgi:hypothetical protein